jgi:hypothetical protein
MKMYLREHLPQCDSETNLLKYLTEVTQGQWLWHRTRVSYASSASIPRALSGAYDRNIAEWRQRDDQPSKGIHGV